LILTLVILAVAITLFLSEKLRPDLVALLTVVALGITGVLTPQETFSGLSRSAVITILAIFILAEGLRRTGVTETIGRALLRLSGAGESRLVATTMLAGAGLSLFMNNIAAAAVLMPGVTAAARRSSVPPSRLLMPLAFGTILGGMATLLTTTNIVVSGLLRDQGLPGFGLLSFGPVGLPLVVVGILYVALWGRRLLPARADSAPAAHAPRATELIDIYRLGERLFRARVPAGSSLTGKSLTESTLREVYGLTVLGIERRGLTSLSPAPEERFREGDVILFEGDLAEFRRRDVEPYLDILPARTWHEADLASATTTIVEAVLAPRSRLIGQTLREANFRERYGMTVLAVWREGSEISGGLSDLSLRFGDALLLQGPRERIPILRSEPDLIVSADPAAEVPPLRAKAAIAVVILAATLGVAAVKPDEVGELMMAGALAMAVAGILTMDQAYEAIDWRTVFLVAGMLPVGIALRKTGAAAFLGGGLLELVGSAGPWVLLGVLFFATALLTQAVNGSAVAVIMAPIAIHAARQIGADPRAFAMGVALATSMAFVTPLGHPVNLLVMGQGGYSFRDYGRVGLSLTLILFAVVMLILPLVWPLRVP
jgi:di/tricarboxylate transporter